MAGRTYFKVKSCCESNPSLSKNFFLSGKADQSIGDALYPHLSQYNVAISEIRTSNSEAGKPSTITQPDTPISGLDSFGVRFIFVDIKQNDSDKRGVAEDKGKGSAKPNVFDVLMNVQRSYDKLPPSRKENNAKDKMYNAVLNLLKKKGVGFTSIQALLGTETTDRDCPGLKAKGTATENDKKHKGVLVAGKVRSFIMCCLCGKRRVVYCKERLSRQQITDIEEVQDSLFYTCGSTLFPTGHRYHETIVVKEGLECTAEMETTYYAGITTKFQPVCFFCGDMEVDSTSQTVQDLRKNYSIVRPICRQCMSKGIQPKVRNALKLNKK